MNDFIYVCSGSFREIIGYDGNSDAFIMANMFLREIISCNSKIEAPFYSAGMYKDAGIYWGNTDNSKKTTDNYPKCEPECSEKDAPRPKIKAFVPKDQRNSKKQKDS